VVLYCKNCRKPFKGFLLGGEIVAHSDHPEFNELCPNCLPSDLKDKVDKHIEEYMERAKNVRPIVKKLRQDRRIVKKLKQG